MAEQLGRYILDRKIAAGGMAEVFLARQSGPGGFEKLCVIKRMLPSLSEDEAFIRMFLDEAKLVAWLNHPNIAQIYDFGEVNGTYYLAMEYVPGATLRAIVKEHTKRGVFIPHHLAAKLVSQGAVALDYAHTAADSEGHPLHIIHRDVSPQNMLLGNTGVVKLIDFGVAKAANASHKTATGLIKGKFAYMSPEQLRGKQLDGRSDIYGLGLVLYELLAGSRAIQGANDAEMMNAAMKMKFDPIEVRRPDIPAPLRDILMKSLAKEPQDRYPNAAAMSADLERYLLTAGVSVTGRDLVALLTEEARQPLKPSNEEPQSQSGQAGVAQKLETPHSAKAGANFWDDSNPAQRTVIDPEFQKPPPPAPPGLKAKQQQPKEEWVLNDPKKDPLSIPTAPRPMPEVKPKPENPKARVESRQSQQSQQAELIPAAEDSASLVRRGVKKSVMPWVIAGALLVIGIAGAGWALFGTGEKKQDIAPLQPIPNLAAKDPNSGKTPVDPNAGKTPVDANAAKTPVDANAAKTPVDPNAAKTPVDANAAKTPGSDAQLAAKTPVDPNAQKTQNDVAEKKPDTQLAAAEIPPPEKKPKKEPVKTVSAGKAEGQLLISSTPVTSVWIDGVAYGRTPVDAKVTSGDHQLLFRDEKLGLKHVREVRVERGEARREEWRAGKGKVSFRVVPFGEVYLESQWLGLTPLPPVELYEGDYSFKFVNKDTQRTETRSVKVEPDKETVVKVDLRAGS